MNTQTQKSVPALFNEILRAEAKMKENSGTDKYYELQQELNKLLREFIRLDFSVLSSKRILKLCALVNSHRPCALHSFLIHCESLIK